MVKFCSFLNMLEPAPEILLNENNQVTNKRKNPRFCQHNKWSQDEDEILCNLVKQFGENDWRHLAKKMEGRNPRQCRERWQYYLNPKLNVDKWTQEEDDLIFSKLKEYGPKWMTIKKFFKNRTDQMIKNRYKVLKKAIDRKMEVFDGYIIRQQTNNKISQDEIIKFEHSNQLKVNEETEKFDYLKYLDQEKNNDYENNNYSYEIDFSVEIW